MKKQSIFNGLGDFLILWASQSFSTLGTAMTNFALIIWVYGQKGTASSITLMSICSFVPSILFCFIAGTLADRWDKKRIMLISDLLAALGTLTVLVLYTTSALEIWHLYIINFLLSFMNAFQSPASYVATSLLVPKEHYIRVSGLQALSRGAVTILAPAFGSALLAFGGLQSVLLFDLITCGGALVILRLFITIPPVVRTTAQQQEPFLKSCMAGIGFLRRHGALLRIILFFAFVNLIAKMGSYGMLPALILGRTGNNQATLGLVEAAVGLGALVGSVLVTLLKPAKSRVRVVLIACGISFLLGDVGLSVSRTPPFWIAAAFISNIPMAFLNANLTAIMRTQIPLDMQGRVFSARDTIQYSTIPLGLFLGGILADHVLEPLMGGSSPLAQWLMPFFGAGKGAGVAILFFMVGIVGFVTSFWRLKDSRYQVLDHEP